MNKPENQQFKKEFNKQNKRFNKIMSKNNMLTQKSQKK